MKSILLCILYLSIIVPVISQEDDENTFREYKEYRMVFDSEVKKFDEHSIKELPRYKVLLPESTAEEFLLLPASDDNKAYVIGISDPGLEEHEGFSQALLRAKSLLSFSRGISIKHISDMYEEEYSDERFNTVLNKYADFYRLNSGLAIDTNRLRIINDTTNKYGETIILLEYIHGSDDLNQIIKCNSDCLITEVRSNTDFEINQRVDILCEAFNKDDYKESYKFTSRRVHRQYDINSFFNGKEIAPPMYTLRYKNTTDISDSIAEMKIRSMLSDGLWNGLIDCLIQNLLIESKLRSSVMKATSDNYSKKHQNMNREVASSNAAIRLEDIYIYNNRIHVDITIFKNRQP